MSYCDYCGASLPGWATTRGEYRFCNTTCADHGKILENLKSVAKAVLDSEIESLREGICPSCNERAKLDVYSSHLVYSVVLYTSWQTKRHYCCRKCGRREQIKAAIFCVLCGWWGVPFGLFITPFQILSNIMGMLRPSTRPSEELKRIAHLSIAQGLQAIEENRLRSQQVTDRKYFICVGEKRVGPATWSDLKRLSERGLLPRSMTLLSEDKRVSITAGDLPGLFGLHPVPKTPS